MNNVIYLIKKYQETVKSGVYKLKTHLSKDNLLDAYLKNEIPRNGKIANGLEYEFHGFGCWMIVDGYEVDFDFGPNNRIDGFDVWRITQFIDDNASIKEELNLDEESIKTGFNELVQNNYIHRPSWTPGVTLYYFK